MQNDQILALLFFVIMALLVLALRRRKWRGSGTSHGTAAWMQEKFMRAAGYFKKGGLVVGRAFSGNLIWIKDFCHILCVGGPGSGKSVGFFIPNLLTYFRGSVVCFDTKRELFEKTARRRAERGERIVCLGPFTGGEDALNSFDTIRRDDRMLPDKARAGAEDVVARSGIEPDQHWNDRAVDVITGVSILVLKTFNDHERNLNSVLAIISNSDLLRATAQQLQDMGGVAANLGSQIKTLFDKEGLTKEGTGVIGTASRYLSFLNSDMVASAVSHSTFRPEDLREPGTTVYIQIPPDQLHAQRGLLRLWVSTLVRAVGAVGDEMDSETLFMLDEASGLGGLPALEEAMVRGRSAGCRCLLGYQSDGQIKAAFKDKPGLIYDNCSVQIYMRPPSSYETASLLSKSLGDYTQVNESYNENESRSSSSSSSASGQHGGNTSYSRGHSYNYSESSRSLMRPEELLTQSRDHVIVLQSGLPPIRARRLKWYADPEFRAGARNQRSPMQLPAPPRIECDLLKPIWANPSRASIIVRLIAAAILVLILWQMVTHPSP